MVFNETYTNYAIGALHPDGSIYQAVQSKKGGVSQLVIRRRNVDGTYTELKRYRSGVDFRGIPGISQAIPMPDGSIYVSTCAGAGDAVVQFEDVLPNACPPFSPGATYQYSVSAEDRQARHMAQAAVQTAQRAEATAEKAEDAVNVNGDNVERRIGEVVEAARNNMSGAGIDAARILRIVSDDLVSTAGTLRHALWPKVQAMVADSIYAQLKNAGSPLINVIKQGGKVIS